MNVKEIELYKYQLKSFRDAIHGEMHRLEKAGLEDGRYERLEDQAEEIQKFGDSKSNEPLEVIVVEERAIADAITNEMYINMRMLIEDGPHTMGELGELARIYRAIFGYGPEQSHAPSNEKPW